jgi:hypothetical protein
MPVSIFDKLQHIKPSGAELSTPQSAAAAAADDSGIYPETPLDDAPQYV